MIQYSINLFSEAFVSFLIKDDETLLYSQNILMLLVFVDMLTFSVLLAVFENRTSFLSSLFSNTCWLRERVNELNKF